MVILDANAWVKLQAEFGKNGIKPQAEFGEKNGIKPQTEFGKKWIWSDAKQ